MKAVKRVKREEQKYILNLTYPIWNAQQMLYESHLVPDYNNSKVSLEKKWTFWDKVCDYVPFHSASAGWP